MPSAIFSHQAPGLFLKVKYPKKLDGAALCFGTFVPDFDSIIGFFFPVNIRSLTHSLIGQIIWTIPIAILATVIFCRFLAPICSSIASQKSILFEPLRYFGVNDWHYFKQKQFNRRFFYVAAYSAFIGGITHLLLDWPSHADVQLLWPWLLWPNPEFLTYSIANFGSISLGPLVLDMYLTVYSLLWLIESLVGLIISLYILRYIKKKELIHEWYATFT